MKILNTSNSFGRGRLKTQGLSTFAPQRLTVLGIITALAFTLVAVPGAFAQSLLGSNFEIDEVTYDGNGDPLSDGANLIVDYPPSLDWAAVTEDRQPDTESGSGDNSFGQGTKEDTEIPTTVTGSIPPNKSDLLTFGVYQESNSDGDFMHLYWTRVQEPTGTTNMDFEFNQSDVTSDNGVTPVRTPGDILIVYELSRGGGDPSLFKFTWLGSSAAGDCEASNSYPCWGNRIDLEASGDATGSINIDPIHEDDSDGLGPLDPYTFGEASIDLEALLGTESCVSFGSAYLKSRSSDSFTSALKDFIAPLEINITNCGTVYVEKVVESYEGDTTEFDFTSYLTIQEGNNNPSFSLADGDTETISNVLAGTGYSITEADPGQEYVLTNIVCVDGGGAVLANAGDTETRTATFDILADGEVRCTFTNTAKGRIIVQKETEPDDDAETFEFKLDGETWATLADGQSYGEEVYLDAGTYNLSETMENGWLKPEISCDDGSATTTEVYSRNIDLSAGETVTCTFTNTKLGSLTIIKEVYPAQFANVSFPFSSDIPDGNGGTESWELAASDAPKVFSNLSPYVYTVTEGEMNYFKLDDISCTPTRTNATFNKDDKKAIITLGAGENITCTFTNSTGAIKVVKKAKNASLEEGTPQPAPQPDVTFEVKNSEGVTIDDYSGKTGTDGTICFGPLMPGVEYTIQETVPTGYAARGGNSQTVTVTARGTCGTVGEGETTPDTVNFVNDPLSKLEINFTSLAGSGVTKVLAVSCSSADGTASPVNSGSLEAAEFTDLLEGTYNCTIVVDP